jgi:hypothetical protein
MFLTPSRTTTYFPAAAAKYHLVITSPCLSQTHPYNPLRITSYNVLFMEMHLFHLNVTHNIQPLQEYYIGIIYLIVLFRMINLETLGHMEGHFTNFTFPSASALDFLVWTHPTLPSWVVLHRIWVYILWKVGPMSCLKPNGHISCWTNSSCIFWH